MPDARTWSGSPSIVSCCVYGLLLSSYESIGLA
jgi:hypothetical protein